MIECNTEKDCSTGQLCINRECAPLTAANLATKVPIWGWAIFAAVVLLIIFIFVRCCCWPLKGKGQNSKSSRLQKSEQGPAPIPKNYMKPVDLLEVADANKKAENAILIQQQKQIRRNDAEAGLYSPESVYPSSSVSQKGDYDMYTQNQMGNPGYYQSQPQYGFQPSYDRNYSPPNQYESNTAGPNSYGIYANSGDKFVNQGPAPIMPNRNLRNMGNHGYQAPDYGYL